MTALGTFDGTFGGGDNKNTGPITNTLPEIATVDILNSSGTVLATAQVGGTAGGVQNGWWAFSSTAVSANLTPGNTYYALALLPRDDANQQGGGGSPVTVGTGVTFVNSEICSTCTSIALAGLTSGQLDNNPNAGWFGADFEYSPTATPVPASLPLFAGGLGFVGYLARRRKNAAAIAAA